MPGRINRQREGGGGGAKINREEARINRGRKRGGENYQKERGTRINRKEARINREREKRGTRLTERKQKLNERGRLC